MAVHPYEIDHSMKNCITIAILLLCNLSTALSAATINNGGSGSVVISVPDNAIADSAIVSLSATDALLPANNAATIGSEILLNSELKGYIEDPCHYFENADAKTDSHLDLLMMTQGWRRYECADIIDGSAPQFQFPVERSQSISGSVVGLFKRRPKGMQIALFSPKTMEMTRFQLGDSSRFVISGLDFTAGTPFTLEALNKNGEATNVTLHVDEPVMPKVATLPEPGIAYNDSAERSLAESARKTLKAPSLLDVQELDEVTVTARKPKKWSNRGNFEPFSGYQSGDERIGHFPTMESMLRSLTVKIKTNQDDTAVPEPIIGEHVNEDFIETPVFIDGFRSEQREMFTLNPQNVNSIEYFRPGDARIATYTLDALSTGVILITTKYGNEGGRTPLLSMENITPLGYQPPVEFYVPKYTGPDDVPPPYRATLYWNPKLQLNPNGATPIKLKGTKPGQLVNITIQGIAPDGKIIDVTKKIQLP